MQNGTSSKGGGGSGAIEKIYQKKSQLEHILLRPDTYIGSVERITEKMWVVKPATEAIPSEIEGGEPKPAESIRMIQRDIDYVPGLYKIFDEILVNAADNKQRDKHMSTIRVDINPEKNVISIWNNGKGIPVVMHKEEKMFVPTMIFGHLLTSSNYNDEEQKVTGGRNGYGAKLCNIFSTSFTVETASREYKKQFKQTWGSNMTKTSDPKISDFVRGSDDFTKITFSPDLAKFKMDKLDDDIVALMSRRAYDIAASTRGVTVFLNGNRLPVKNFKDYIDLYLKESKDDAGNPLKIVYENVNERWEVAVVNSDRGFQQVSFVNSIATTKGGRHVDHVVDSIVKQLIEVVSKKNKGGIKIKPFQVRPHIFVFINCLIVNPTFDSQTKENMTLQAKSFGSKCPLSDKFITGVMKCGIVESVLTWAKFKEQNDLAKTSGKKNSKIRGIPKLEDANDAGSKNSHLCTLILTEGDSAKSLAVSGLGVIGRDHYGVFPLRGKLLNVREATHKQILENLEINNLIKILGLQYKKKYLSIDDLKSLRYGKVMIMTDQDQDGSHIKGLLINFIHTNWPELLRLPFLEEFITPIVKAIKDSRNEELCFYSLPEFEEWKTNTPNHKTYKIKYYKGLGTSKSSEAKKYFEDMERHRILFKYDGTQDDENIVMAFAKKSVDQRKEWLTNHMDECKRRKLLNLPDRYLYVKGTKAITYSEFINLELILFSNADNVRSIPSLMDGFKPGQRKVMYTCFKRNDKNEVKVAQLAGSVAEKSAYHHGEASLCMTIVNLAQNYVGSNNINLLIPEGQFGTRLQGGKDSASARYIFTKMSPLTRLIFHPDDDPLLQYEYDDNQKIEPTWYCPIIPMVLINGAEGIGTGWSTKIANHNPRDVVKNLRLMISKEEPETLHPWYKNFNGTIEYIAENRYLTNGNVAIIPGNRIEITELPVGTWTQTYKENVLEPLLHGSDKVKAIISDYKEYHTDTTVRFVITFAAGEFDRIRREDGGFHRVFKLSSSISTGQMHAFDHANCLRRFNLANDILKEFYDIRLEYYYKRKAYLEGQLQAQADRLTDQARFIVEKCDRTIIVENKKRKVMVDELIKRGYRPDPVREWQRKLKLDLEEESTVDETPIEEIDEAETSTKKEKGPVDAEKAFQKLTDVQQFDYLLGMSMWMLTEEKKNELLKQRDVKLAELKALKAKTSEALWLDDLDAFEMKLDEVEENERLEELGMNKKKGSKASAKSKGGRGSLGKRAPPTEDIFPSKNGVQVKFKVTEDILKKFEKMAAVKKEKTAKKDKGDDPSNSQNKSAEVFDEFDALVEDGKAAVKGKEQQIKKEPTKPQKLESKPKTEPVVEKKKRGRKPADDGLKQSKLNFDGVTKRNKKKTDDDDDDDDITVIPNIPAPAPRDRPGRRAASKKINYSALLGGDEEDEDDDDAFINESSGSELELHDNTAVVGNTPMGKLTDNDDDDDDDSPLPSSDIDNSPIKKKPTKPSSENGNKKSAAVKRPRKIIELSDSSEEEVIKKSKKKKAVSDSDSDFDI